MAEPRDLTRLLGANAYPGRGILLGLSPRGQRVALYFIMGRSQNSQNRVFVREGDGFCIALHDPALVEDPSLILYRPLAWHGGQLVVTNGDQTDTVVEGLKRGQPFEQTLQARRFEPDAPHFTPRISGIQRMDTGAYTLSILKAGDPQGTVCQRFFYQYEPRPGMGHFIHTYQADGTPLPAFEGEPVLVALPEDLEAFAQEVWHSLNQQNRVALYAQAADAGGRLTAHALHNRHPIKEAP